MRHAHARTAHGPVRPPWRGPHNSRPLWHPNTPGHRWDYGQLQLYVNNNKKLLLGDDDHEAATMRAFFGVAAGRVSADSTVGAGVAVSGGSCVASSKVGSGSVAGSLLSSVNAASVTCEGAILVNVTAKSIRVAPGCVVYNVATAGDLVLDEAGSVLTTALLGGTGGAVDEVPMRSRVDLDGGKAWKEAVLANAKSFEQVYEANSDADVGAMEAHSKGLHAAAAAGAGL